MLPKSHKTKYLKNFMGANVEMSFKREKTVKIFNSKDLLRYGQKR